MTDAEHKYTEALLRLEGFCKSLREGTATAQQYTDQRRIMNAQVKMIARRARAVGEVEE